MDMLDDYEHNRLGPVDDMPAPLLFYLRVTLAERNAWSNWQQEMLMPDG